MTERFVFDFDGVLLHSHVETMLTAFNVAQDTLLLDPAELSETYVTLFGNNRGTVRNAGEMVTLAKWCVQPELTADMRLSREQLVALFPAEDEVHRRAKAFFEKRGILYNEHPEKWLDLNAPYQTVWQALQRADIELLIVTHKNKEAVVNLCKYYELRVAEEAIFSGDGGASKSENFKKLFAAFPADKYYFIDDNFRNLLELREDVDLKTRLHLLYASWGYGSERDALDAKEAGLTVHTQESLVDFVSNLNLV